VGSLEYTAVQAVSLIVYHIYDHAGGQRGIGGESIILSIAKIQSGIKNESPGAGPSKLRNHGKLPSPPSYYPTDVRYPP
jgi:hypothetical protein